jgi:V/A-type H+-transporting ATPase subunit A
MGKWFNENVSEDWMPNRQKLMSILQDEAELQEIVQMVGMDALSPSDQLKMEAARSIREDFLHQNSFHDVDTYTSLQKQKRMMELVIDFHEKAQDALTKGATVGNLIKMPVREKIGRYKYTLEENIESEFEAIEKALDEEIAGVIGKEDF